MVYITPKKPSERIIELARQIIKERKDLDLSKATHGLDLRLEAITRYLDEQHEEQSSQTFD